MADPITAANRRLIKELHRLDAAAADNIERSQQIKARIGELLGQLESGDSLPEILDRIGGPVIPGLITENITALHDVGSSLRRAEAAALRAHGYTMERIAGMFGVTRQRISALLQGDTPPG